MIAKTRKPISVLLAVLMIVGLYASIPFTASAGAPGWYETDFADLKDGDVVIIINTYTNMRLEGRCP